MRHHNSTQPHIRTQFRRYECKYLVSEELASEVRAYARPYLEPDPYAAVNPDHSYDIMSLYLDSRDLRLFWETEEGQLSRIKLRIRSYDDSLDSPAFLEIKRRFNNLVLKGRARVQKSTVGSILAGSAPDLALLPVDQQACFDEFNAWMARWLTQPTVWVKYRREAYVGIYNRDVRVTMDRDLVCAAADGWSESSRATEWTPVETHRVVLEVKFDESYPDWVTRLIKHFGLQRRSYSKYGHSIRRGLPDWSLSPIDSMVMGS